MINIGIGIPFGQRSAGIDPQAKIAFDSLQSAGFTTPQGITGINAAFKTIKTIYGTSDITTAISFFGDPSLAYQIGAGSGTTLGQAIRTLPNIIDPTRATDAVQTTAASQPLLLVHSGVNYYFSTGLNTDFISTPNATQNQLINDFSIEAISRDARTTSTTKLFCAKRTGGTATTFSYQFVYTSELLSVILSNGSSIFSYNSTTTLNANAIGFRVSRNSATGIIKFFQSTDGINYTQLGTDVAGFTGNIFNLNSPLTIGNNVLNTSFVKIESCIFYKDDSFTTPTQIFNPNQYNAATSQTQWTSSTGEVWSLNVGTAATGYKGVLVDRTIMQGDGVDDRLSATALANKTVLTKYVAEKFSGNAQYLCSNSSNAMLIYTNGSGVIRASSATEVVFNNATRFTRTDLLTAVFDTSGITLVNNANQLTGNLSSAGTGTGLFLFSGSSGSFMCATINTYIESIGANNSTQRTGIYNYIRSINGNAF